MADNTLRFRAILDDKVSQKLGVINKGFDKAFGKGSSASLWGNVGAKAVAKGFDLVGSAANVATEFVFDSIDASSRLEQSVGAVDSVLGPAAAKIEKFGKTAANQFGLSKRAVNDLAAVTSAQLKSMGFGLDESADKSIELQKRAADLAATFGGPVEDAVGAISALLRGERDPIERYGVSIKDVDVKARVAAKGLDTSTTAAKKHADALASLELLLEQTADATGQFARESESAAGQQARLAAEAENTSAMLGEKFLPAVVGSQRAILDVLDDSSQMVSEVRRQAQDGSENAQKIMGDLERISAATGETLEESWHRLNAAGNDATVAIQRNTDTIITDLESRRGKAFKDFAITAVESDKKVIESSENLIDQLIKDSFELVDEVYDPLITKNQIIADKAELAAQKRILASNDATTAEKRNAREAIASLEKSITDQRIKLLQAGKLSKKGQQLLLEDLRDKQKDASKSGRAAIQRLIDKVKELGRITAPGVDVTVAMKIGGKATGGFWAKGEPALVGEKGPELAVAAEDKWVYDAAATGRMMGGDSVSLGGAGGGRGGLTINFNSIWPPTQQQAREIAELLDRENYRELQRAVPTSGRV